MPRKITIPAYAQQAPVELTLQQAFRVLFSDGIRVSAGSVNHHPGGMIDATVLLKDEGDQPRAFRLLRDAGVLPDREKTFAMASEIQARSCAIKEQANGLAKQQSFLQRSLNNALQDLQRIEHRLEDLQRLAMALRHL